MVMQKISMTHITFGYTVSSRVYAQFWTAHIPLYGSKVILKSVVTQCESWLGITPTSYFFLIWLETLCTYTCEDTVMTIIFQG